MKPFREKTLAAACLIAAGAMTIVGCAPSEPSSESSATGTVKVLAVEGPETDSLATQAETFSKDSGITVQVDKVARDVWGQRKVAELAQGAGTYDVVFLGGGDDAVWMLNHAKAKDLTPYLGKDLISGITNNELFTTKDGKFLAAPQYYNFPVTLYRQDLFNDPAEKDAFKNQFGRELKPPTTFDELVDIAKFFNRPNDNLYGTCLGGVDWSVYLDDTYFVYGQGSNFGDLETGDLTLNSPEHVKALTYIDQLTKLSPPGWEAMSFFDCDNQVQSGSVAIYQNWLYAWRVLKESMGDKIAMAPLAGSPTHLGSMIATIPESAPNPDAAGEFIKWMLSDEYQLSMVTDTGNLPVLKAQLENSDFKKVLPEMDMLKEVAGDLTYVHTTWTGELSTGVSEAIAKVYAGEMTPQQAADWLQNEKFAGRQALE